MTYKIGDRVVTPDGKGVIKEVSFKVNAITRYKVFLDDFNNVSDYILTVIHEVNDGLWFNEKEISKEVI